MNVLIVAAHPDDEILGCGGTMARLAKEGNAIYTLILSEGITSRNEKSSRHENGKEIKKLRGYIGAANKIIGGKNIFIFDFPDNRFDTVALLDIIKIIEKTKENINPDVVFTHHYGDLNIDHQITFRAVMTAFRPLKSEKVREIYSFEAPSSTEWNASLSSTSFMPNYFVDISKTLQLKIRALKKYKSEIREFPHPRSEEAIKTIAECWGIKVGLNAAEAFETIRIIR